MPDAGKRHRCVFADQRIVVDPQDGDVIRNGIASLQADRFDFCGIVVAVAEDPQRFGQPVQRAFQPSALGAPVVDPAARMQGPRQILRTVAALLRETVGKTFATQFVQMLVFGREIGGLTVPAFQQMVGGGPSDQTLVAGNPGHRNVGAEDPHVDARHLLAADVADEIRAFIDLHQHAVAHPPLRQRAPVADGQVPSVFGGVTADPLADTVIVEFHQNEYRIVFHGVSIMDRPSLRNRNRFLFMHVIYRSCNCR